MATWKVAESLDRLLAQLNAIAPNRSKVSDGSIGDAAHAARTSDHDPWLVLSGQPLVSARDFTNDPAGGLNCAKLRDALVRARDSRVKYLIFNDQIISGSAGPAPWTARSYAYAGPGRNRHEHHLHLSVVADERCRDASPWMLPGLAGGAATPAPTSGAVLRKGDSGPEVLRLQTILTTRYPAYAHWSPLTDFFGDQTDAAVREFQRRSGLVPDGIVGPLTRKALGL